MHYILSLELVAGTFMIIAGDSLQAEASNAQRLECQFYTQAEGLEIRLRPLQRTKEACSKELPWLLSGKKFSLKDSCGPFKLSESEQKFPTADVPVTYVHCDAHGDTIRSTTHLPLKLIYSCFICLKGLGHCR